MTEPQLQWNRVQACKVSVPDHVVHRRFVSETVLLNIQTGYYHGMDEIGTRFFEVLRETSNVGQAVEVLAREFEAPAERIREDMVRFCSELVARGLIELNEARA